MEPPQPSDLLLSLQLAGVEGVHEQMPASVEEEPTQVFFVYGAVVEHGQVRKPPSAASWKTLDGTVEQDVPTAPVAPYDEHV